MKRHVVILILFLIASACVVEAGTPSRKASIAFEQSAQRSKGVWQPQKSFKLTIENFATNVTCETESELLTTICGLIIDKTNAGEMINLSLIDYSTVGPEEIFGNLNRRNIFAIPDMIVPQEWSPMNNITWGGIQGVIVRILYAEARTAHRCKSYRKNKLFHKHDRDIKYPSGLFQAGVSIESLCTSARSSGLECVVSSDNVYIPDLDILAIFDNDGNNILASCHFLGEDIFPFEGCNMSIPPALLGIENAEFSEMEIEELFKLEFGDKFDVSFFSDEAALKEIMNGPMQSKVKDLLHKNIAINKLGTWNKLSSSMSVLSKNNEQYIKNAEIELFYSAEYKIVVIANEKRALCVIQVFDDNFRRSMGIVSRQEVEDALDKLLDSKV